MTWLDIITPIPQTLILLFLFIRWLFKDLAGITDASPHPFLLVLMELAKSGVFSPSSEMRRKDPIFGAGRR